MVEKAKIKSTRFQVGAKFKSIIQINDKLGKLTESPDDDEWFNDEHRIPLKKLLQRYGSHMTKGLDPLRVDRNRVKYGSNTFTPTAAGSLVKKVVRSFFLGLNVLIWLCVIFSLATALIEFTHKKAYDGELLFGLALILVVIISGCSFYYQEYKSARVMESFDDIMAPRFAMVRRDGHFREVFVDEVVVGDLVKLTYGDVIPADIRLIECNEFYVDNSSLTGESDPKRRSSVCTDNDPMESKNLVFFSTHAVEGHAKGVCIAVGRNTVMGKMAELASSKAANKAKSPIAAEMESFIKHISMRSLIFGTTFLIISIILGFSWKDSITFFTQIIVASVPEGLNLAYTLLLVTMAKRMARNNCVVKNMHALDTLSAASIICTDKTGTLTQNKMSVAHLWFNDKYAEADTSEFIIPSIEEIEESKSKSIDKLDPGFKALARVARLCSRAKFKREQGDVPVFRRGVTGDASEAAILRFMESQAGSVRKFRSRFKRLCEIPFNSRMKYQVFVHEITENNVPIHLVTLKGAPERVWKMCNRVLIRDQEYPMTEEWKAKFDRAMMELGSLGERVIGFADGLLPPEKYNESYEYTPEKPEFLNIGLRFVGLLSMIDPPRAAVPDAIRKCRAAGVKVVMITGDHPTTATAVAKVVGIISEDSEILGERSTTQKNCLDSIKPVKTQARIITGSEIKRMDSDSLQTALFSSQELIFARVNPEQKYDIIDAFQRLGHFVAAAGDGVNDSPALKKADIGLSMGITGTEVSKAISDLVLMDDNFTSVVHAIEEGRKGFESLRKILRYTLADNMAEMYSFCLCVILDVPLPLGTMAILLSVLGTDLLPAASLMYETPESDVMKKKPRNTEEHRLFTTELLMNIYGQVAVIQVITGYFSYFATMASYGFLPWTLIGIRKSWENNLCNDLVDSYGQEWPYGSRLKLEKYAQTVFFVSVVIMQIANLIICKCEKTSILQKKMGNWRLNFAIICSLGLTCLVVYVHPIGTFFGMTAVTWIDWTYPIPFAIFLIIYDELRRLYVRKSIQYSCGNSLVEVFAV